ncbi:MAG: NADH:ubiquinone reductase (Na(+)-transporting) subunit F [Burkholderiales bacterium]
MGLFGGLFKEKGPFKVTIQPSGLSLEVPTGDNLLKAALEQGLAWPHSCRVGSCTTCKCRLVSGKIKPLNDFSYVLSAEDLKAGVILACQTLLKSDIEVEVKLDDKSAPKEVKTVLGVISASTALTHDILEVRIRLDEALPPYWAGQYAEITAPGIAKPRSYSFARAPENEQSSEVSFHCRLVPGGEMTGWLHAQSRVGERVTVAGPYGSFWLRDAKKPMVCVAGGSGMAPIKALLEHASNEKCDRPVVYLFGARAQRDVYCKDEMQRLSSGWNGSLKFVPVLSNEPEDSDWSGPRGFVHKHIAQQGLDLSNCQAYLCGPPPMIDAAIAEFKAGGMPDDQIYFDKFLDASHTGGRA